MNYRLGRWKIRADQSGLTLVELTITLALVAIVSVYGIPSLQTTLANGRQTSAVNRFIASVLLARSLAVTSPTKAVICPSHNGVTCVQENDWSHGWIVTHELPASETHQDSPRARLIRTELKLSGVVLTTNRTAFHFRPRGGRATNGTAVFCTPNASRPKAVIVSYNGRPRVSKVRADGQAITCAY